MARTNATNFTGGLQFPYATAATDLFKKEDVQTLAQAVDQHDHSTGKGLALPAGYITNSMIADGTITGAKIANATITSTQIANLTITQAQLAVGSVDSSKIVDGTIDRPDLGTNVVTRRYVVYGATANPTTTSAAFVDLTDMLLSFTLPYAADVLCELSGPFSGDAANRAITIGLSIDGAGEVGSVFGYSTGATLPQYIGSRYLAVSMGAGAHTVRGRWAVNAGTATANSTARVLTAVAFMT